MPATEHLFVELPPSYLYLDTDFVINYIFAQQPFHQRAEQFGLWTWRHSQSEIYVSPLLWMEFLHVVKSERFRSGLDDAATRQFQLDRWHQSVIREQYLTAQLGILQQFLDQFVCNEVSLSPDVRKAATKMMLTYNLDSHDAIHLATMDASGILDMVSFDEAFRRVDGLHLWNDQVHSRTF